MTALRLTETRLRVRARSVRMTIRAVLSREAGPRISEPDALDDVLEETLADELAGFDPLTGGLT